jgi:hypothetical protein
MPVTKEPYDQHKIDKLKYFLTDMESKGHSRPFEIFVDALKVVPKSMNVKDFDNYEHYINEDTQKLKILIYNTEHSPRNDQYCFYMNNIESKSVNGLGDLDGIIQEKLSARDREYELKQLKQDLADTKQQLKESEDYAEELEKQLEESRSNKFKLGNLNLVELGGALIENLAAKNSSVLDKVGLSGLLGGAKQEPVIETEASFQKKEQTDEIKPEHFQYIPLIQQLDQTFDREQLELVMQIIQRFAEEPAQLKTVAELLNIIDTPKQY